MLRFLALLLAAVSITSCAYNDSDGDVAPWWIIQQCHGEDGLWIVDCMERKGYHVELFD